MTLEVVFCSLYAHMYTHTYTHACMHDLHTNTYTYEYKKKIKGKEKHQKANGTTKNLNFTDLRGENKLLFLFQLPTPSEKNKPEPSC